MEGMLWRQQLVLKRALERGNDYRQARGFGEDSGGCTQVGSK